jgi:hypothetical protein
MLPVLLALAACSAAHADVTIKSTTVGKGLGMTGTMTGLTYIKGLKMRNESTAGDRKVVTIYDVDAQKMYIVNEKKKEVEAWDMAAFAQQMSQTVAPEGMQGSLTPNGQTKPVAGQTAEGYDINVTTPATIGGAGGMKVTVQLTGVSWVVKGVPGAADYAAFYQGAADKGWIFSDPRAAQGAPGQARAMARMYAEFAKLGGIPYETDVNVKAEGEGVMGAMMAKLGNVTMHTTTESVDATPVDDALFVPPAEYTLKQN